MYFLVVFYLCYPWNPWLNLRVALLAAIGSNVAYVPVKRTGELP
jgi:hypothetical protein